MQPLKNINSVEDQQAKSISNQKSFQKVQNMTEFKNYMYLLKKSDHAQFRPMTQGKNTVSYDNFAVPKKPKSVSKMDTQQNTQKASFEDINKIAAGTNSYLNS